MAEWITVLGLILIGLGLIIVEIILVPGTTVVGILGLIAAVAGVWMSFENFGATTGMWVTSGTGVVFGLSLFLSFRSGAWRRFALKSAIKSKVNEGLTTDLKIGDKGKALSALRPMDDSSQMRNEHSKRRNTSHTEGKSEIRSQPWE